MLITILFYLSLAIIIWVSWGITIAVLKGLVYFRGPKHMIDCYIHHPNPAYKQMGQRILDSCGGSYFKVFISLLWCSILFPPLMTFDLLIDMMMFSWSNDKPSNKNKP